MSNDNFIEKAQCLIGLPIKDITSALDDNSLFIEFEGYNLMLTNSLDHYGYELLLYKDSGDEELEDEECSKPLAELDLPPDTSGFVEDLRGLINMIENTIEEWE